jgi:hypothetical protein
MLQLSEERYVIYVYVYIYIRIHIYICTHVYELFFLLQSCLTSHIIQFLRHFLPVLLPYIKLKSCYVYRMFILYITYHILSLFFHLSLWHLFSIFKVWFYFILFYFRFCLQFFFKSQSTFHKFSSLCCDILHIVHFMSVIASWCSHIQTRINKARIITGVIRYRVNHIYTGYINGIWHLYIFIIIGWYILNVAHKCVVVSMHSTGCH